MLGDFVADLCDEGILAHNPQQQLPDNLNLNNGQVNPFPRAQQYFL